MFYFFFLIQGQAEVTVDFSPATRKALVVSTYQMMILLVFNSFKRVTYKQMLDMTGIPKSEIANHLLSLCHPKVQILLKRPNTKKLEDSHQFMINAQYKNQLKKVTIPLLRAVDTEENSEEENKCIELQRRHQMDAAIVRIMKTRKTMRHNLLVAEVMAQLSARFKPRPNDIKKRVEALIEQEYMERDPAERGQYNYRVSSHTHAHAPARALRAACLAAALHLLAQLTHSRARSLGVSRAIGSSGVIARACARVRKQASLCRRVSSRRAVTIRALHVLSHSSAFFNTCICFNTST
jgi:hypothetical protein